MSQKQVLYFILLFSCQLFAQNKVVEIKIEGQRSLTGLKNSKTGNTYVNTSKHVVMAKYKEARLQTFDENLNELYNVEINAREYVGNPNYMNRTYPTKYGSYYYNVDQLINNKGEVVEYFDRVSILLKSKKKDAINTELSFYNDFGSTVIGPQLGRSNYKKKYDYKDLFVSTIRNDNFQVITAQLEFPNIKMSGKEDNLNWIDFDSFNKGFMLISFEKDDDSKQKEHKKNWHCVLDSYQGKNLLYANINLNIGDKFFVPDSYANINLNIGDKFFVPDSPERSIYVKSIGGLGTNPYKIFYNEQDETFLLYGFYNNEKKSNKGKVEAHGIYFHKFDRNGNLLLEKYFTLPEAKKSYALHKYINYEEFKGSGLFTVGIEEDELNLYEVNPLAGTLIKKHFNILDGYNNSFKNSLKKEIVYFSSIYSKKSLKNRYFSLTTIKGLSINSEIGKYIEKQLTKNKLYYDAQILNDKSVILKEFNSKGRVVKLLKFN
jgi:hypothetical protein